MEKRLKEKVEQTCEGVVEGLGFEPVDVRVNRGKKKVVVKVYIDREGGVTLDDCAQASELVGQVLERDGVIEGPYVLEVMSPGIDRRLNKARDYQRSVGKRIRIVMDDTFEGKGEFSGILMEAGDESFSLETGDEMLELFYEAVSSARLDPELPW